MIVIIFFSQNIFSKKMLHLLLNIYLVILMDLLFKIFIVCIKLMIGYLIFLVLNTYL